MNFSASECAFEGFRIARRHPVAIAIWAVAAFVFSLLVALALIGLAGPQMAEMANASRSGVPMSPEQSMALVMEVLPAYGVTLVISLGYYAVMLPAVERSVLRPETGAGRGYLGLGRVELRHLGSVVVQSLIQVVAYFAVVIVAVALGGGLSALLSPWVGAPLGIAAFIGGIVLMLWLMARFVFAGSAALIEGGLGLKRSWALSKGRTWPLLGGLVIAVILAIVVGLLLFAVFAGLAAAIGGMAAVGQAFSPNMSSVQTYFTPLMIAYIAFSSLSSALTFAILIGYGASAYQHLAGRSADVAGAFD